MNPHVFVVAGEESGDRLGGALIAAIRRQTEGRVRFSGVGGAAMAAAGVSSLFPLGDLAIIGFASIPTRLRGILRRIRETADAVVAARPDVLVIIDSPEFTHRIARIVRSRVPDVQIIDYVCPSVWAWRPGRARTMRTYIDQVLALLPFEPAAMEKLGGPLCRFVGHPLTEQVNALRPNELEGRLRRADPPLLLVLPGSRSSEILRIAPAFGAAVARVADQYGPIEVVVPSVPRLADLMRAEIAKWSVPGRVVTATDDKSEAFRTARAALTKSGTSTLELALAGVPMVAAYKVSFIEALTARLLINIPTVILANLVLEESIVPEFLQQNCTALNLADALLPLLSETPERQRQIDAFARLDSIMGVGVAKPSEKAAEAIFDCLASRIKAPREFAKTDLREG